MPGKAAKHAIVEPHRWWQTVAVRAILVPAVVVGLVLGIAEGISSTGDAKSIPMPGTADAAIGRAGRRPEVTSPPAPERPAADGDSADLVTAGGAWKRRITNIVGGKSAGVAVRLDGDVLYEHNARGTRVPASNEKLLLSMALFDVFGSGKRIVTRAVARKVTDGVVAGDLYVLGSGDPTVTGGGRFGTSLPIRPTRLKRLARHIRNAGIRKIKGRIVGATNYFRHDWFAPGWQPEFPSQFVALPSALTFDGNTHRGIHVSDPERRAAVSLTRKLDAVGVDVIGSPAAGPSPDGLTEVARVQSEPLRILARFMNRTSSNFFAEVLGKRLGAEWVGRPGTIAKGATAIRAWARAHGVTVSTRDASGLSYANRVSPRGITKLLAAAEVEPWWAKLRSSLPTGGEGTLEDRLQGIHVRAKTGTLEGFSALSGWVWLAKRKQWAAFSILSAGMPKYKAVAMENKIVRVLHARAG